MLSLRFILSLGRMLPPGFAWWVGGVLGDAFGRLPMRDQRRCRIHLAKGFPERDADWVERTARKSFRHMGRMAAWSLATLHRGALDMRKGVALEGVGNLQATQQACRRREGTVGFTGHFGNWDLLARLGGTLFPMAAVGRPLRNQVADALVIAVRRSGGAEVVYQDAGVLPMLRVLRQGHLLAVLIDQDIPRLAGTWVPWFGDLALTPTGPGALALLGRAGVQPVFMRWRHGSGPVGGGRWIMHFGPRRTFTAAPGEDREAVIYRLTAWITAYQESIVRRAPGQWVWWHLRWRTRPPAGWSAGDAGHEQPERK